MTIWICIGGASSVPHVDLGANFEEPDQHRRVGVEAETEHPGSTIVPVLCALAFIGGGSGLLMRNSFGTRIGQAVVHGPGTARRWTPSETGRC